MTSVEEWKVPAIIEDLKGKEEYEVREKLLDKQKLEELTGLDYTNL